MTEYPVRFIENGRGQIVLDRAFNTVAMLKLFYSSTVDLAGRIRWNVDDPNPLRLSLPGGSSVATLVTRRSQTTEEEQKRIETSELMRMVMDDPSGMNSAKVMGSQCFTKYKWRSVIEAAKAGGPAIVATQVVSEFPLPTDASGAIPSFKPTVIYTYKMQFQQESN